MKKILSITLLITLILTSTIIVNASGESEVIKTNTIENIKETQFNPIEDIIGIWYNADSKAFIEITDTHVNVGYPYSEYVLNSLIKDIKTIGTIQIISLESYIAIDEENLIENEVMLIRQIGSDDFIIFNKTQNVLNILDTEYTGKDLNDFYDNYFTFDWLDK